jgi:DNA topoisomerase-1
MTASTPSIDPAILREEGLRYVTDTSPGITRKRSGKGFAFYRANGTHITDEDEIARIKALAVPPAWTDVWICPNPNGHIQATGIDAKGRKQYRYHPRWREVRDAAKYEQIVQFAELLPTIRKRINVDMQRPGLPREKVLAAVVHLLEATLIRVGNAEYARTNDSYGLTTMREKHVEIDGGEIRFQFTGKSGKNWNLSINDRRIAKVMRACSELPGYELFKYQNDNGELVDVTSSDVNAYLKEITDADVTAKDFRTWAGTVLAAVALDELETVDSAVEAKKNVVQAIEQVAKQLGNTPTICRKCYVHPAILDSYLDGELAKHLSARVSKKVKSEFDHLSPEEVMVLAFLRKRLTTGATA